MQNKQNCLHNKKRQAVCDKHWVADVSAAAALLCLYIYYQHCGAQSLSA
jgi:hypothetical protein